MSAGIEVESRGFVSQTGGKTLGNSDMPERMELVLRVWNEDKGRPSHFLGELMLTGDALLEMATGAQNMVREAHVVDRLIDCGPIHCTRFGTRRGHRVGVP